MRATGMSTPVPDACNKAGAGGCRFCMRPIGTRMLAPNVHHQCRGLHKKQQRGNEACKGCSNCKMRFGHQRLCCTLRVRPVAGVYDWPDKKADSFQVCFSIFQKEIFREDANQHRNVEAAPSRQCVYSSIICSCSTCCRFPAPGSGRFQDRCEPLFF